MKASLMIGLGGGLELIMFNTETAIAEHIGIRHINGSHLSVLDLGLATKHNIEGIQYCLEQLKIHAS